MKRLGQELRIVPPVAWLIAALVYGCLAAVLAYVTSLADSDFESWGWGRPLFVVLVPALLGVFVVVIGYVNADARRRGMRHVMWTLLAVFIPNALGIILYFLLRDPLMTPCPSCGTLLKHGFAFCPKCGGALANACPQCRKPVEAGWSHCTTCGTKLEA